jgi:glycosyltransferase involved in cell wall biosynthesis
MMQIRGDVKRYPGGDFVQLSKTRDHLEKLGVEVDVSHAYDAALANYDLVHLFNVTRITETYRFLKNAISQSKKIVLSPIYHSLKDMEDFYRHRYRIPGFDMVTYLALKEIYYPLRSRTGVSLKCVTNYRRTVREVFSNSDMILPNSALEAARFEQELGIAGTVRVIPNATDRDDDYEPSLDQRENTILCVGRIDPCKNTLNLVEAFQQVRHRLPDDAQLIFIGATTDSHRRYAKKFLRRTKMDPGHIKYVGELPHEEVMSYLKRARLLVLASYFETTGLVGLEALSCRSNVVMTERGYTREYFSDAAAFCNPYSVDSIAEAILKGFYASVSEGQINKLLMQYNWENAARLTLEAYREVSAVR